MRWEGDRGEKALARWRAVAREAAKQARRDRWPQVTDPEPTAAVAARLAAAGLALVLHESADRGFVAVAGNHRGGGVVGDVVVVVGPEGGIAEAELAAFTAAGAVPVRLGPEVLRTSTAGVVTVAALSAVLGRWGTDGPVP
jgi:16S rRNA (uracil1498-N3)-methyltransferase